MNNQKGRINQNLIFKSERLLFTPLGLEDIDISLELWTDPLITKYVGGVRDEQELVSNHETYMRRCAGGCIGVWVVSTLEGSEKIGSAILLPMPIDEDDTNWDIVTGEDLPDAEIEVGYVLKKSAWGKGYATEICKRMLEFGFETTALNEIVATTDVANDASQHVLEKSGMIPEGFRRSYGEDCPGFRITRQQWRDRLRFSLRGAEMVGSGS